MLENYIQGKKIIIVGPSPHLIGKQKGSFIDSFDTVIRVNEFGITPDLEKDYGSRTDISFLTLSEEAIQIYLQMKEDVNYENLKLIVHPRDEYNFNPLTNIREEINVKEYYKLLNLNVDFYQITEPSFKKRFDIFECFPSTGSLAMIEILNYKFSELYICGFSFYTTKYRYTPKGMEYFRIPKKNQHKHNFRQGGHNTRQEIKILKKYINKKDNIDGDKLFRKIILSKTNIYYELRRFYIYKINIDNFKNVLKKTFRKKTYKKLIERYF